MKSIHTGGRSWEVSTSSPSNMGGSMHRKTPASDLKNALRERDCIGKLSGGEDFYQKDRPRYKNARNR